FEWITNCEHVRPGFYQVDFYAHDNKSYFGQPSTQMLSAHHVVKIYVKPPPATGLTAVAANREITLNWDVHACDSIDGYEIFRNIGMSGWVQDSVCCESDPEMAGFQLIGTNFGRNNTTFVDNNNGLGFEFGVDYCYVVRAITTTGVRTCTTDEVCVQIKEDFAVLTKDSIWVTDAAGTISVNWTQPSEIDTIFPDPYTYTLLRADEISGAANWTTIATRIPFSDTTFVDQGMNTSVRGYRYRVDVYDANDELITEGNVGSSIFLTISAGDRQLTLTWREFVPWDNRIYYIYRADDMLGPLTLIDSVVGTGGTQHSYTDTDLTNFEDYCYVIVSEGEYGTPETPDSVRNASQRACGIPQDFEPPCIGTVVFDTSRDCRSHTITFNWTNPDSACGADIDYWTIYRADNRAADFVEIARVDSGVNVFTVPNIGSIADCYGVSATDTNGNESALKIYCFENCPEVELSNVFTPNGDGINDFFAPIRDRNVQIDQVLIYDRWGATVYSTTSVPELSRLWDGRNNKGQDLPDGVYYYVVRYSEDRLPGFVPKPPLVGHVTVLR
ncbi:MAG: gliding motility-associated C-terminal domain-containing protein, partial [Bacteroidota bacterium]